MNVTSSAQQLEAQFSYMQVWVGHFISPSPKKELANLPLIHFVLFSSCHKCHLRMNFWLKGLSCKYISSYNIHRWHTILTYTHKHITWTRAYTNTCVSQLAPKMTRKKFTIIKLVMQTYTVKPSPLHSKNLGRC